MQPANSEIARFWRDYLAGYGGLLNLGLEYPRPPVQAFNKRMERVGLPAECVARGYSYPNLLTALVVLLHCYTGQKDLVIGVLAPKIIRESLEGRSASACEPLPLRVEVDSRLSLARLRDHIEAALTLVYRNRCYRPGDFAEHAELDSTTAWRGLFQVVALPAEWPSEESAVDDLVAQMRYELGPFQAGSDLAFQVREAGPGAEVVCEFDTDLWSARQMRRMLGHLRVVICKISVCPDLCVRDLSLVEGDEFRTLVTEWARGDRRARSDQGPYELIEAQIASNPNATAVVSEECRVCYRELGERVDRLADRLRRQAVHAEVTVGLCTGRSSAFPVGLLAILKAGGVCVPLDPDLPAERLRLIIEDAGVELIVAQSDVVDLLPELALPVIGFDEDLERGVPHPGGAAYAAAEAANLAYIVYTSGSTGTPKGVMVDRGALADLLAVQSSYFGLGRDTRMLWFASPGFDATVFEVLLPLVGGGALIIAPPRARTDTQLLERVLSDHDVDIAILPPSLLARMDPERCRSLRQVVSVGEDCPETVALNWSEERIFYNGYGPTEATIAATVASYAREVGKPPIGRPIAHRLVYVLDHALHPVPVGVAGELFLGGSALARGYLRRPGMTAERFLPDPFCRESGARMYKTGDLARFRPDGQLEYVGRSDQQIQLRGVRLEPGEVECLLSGYPGVGEAAVALRGSEAEQRLVAFVTVNEGAPPSAHELRAYLRNLLPSPLVPVDYRILDVLPRTPNGKVDRRLLSTLAPETGGHEGGFTAPRSSVEKRVAGIWSEVFGVSAISLNDDFFALGGHSLLIAQVLSRVRDAYHVEMEARDLLEASTVRAFAARVSDKLAWRESWGDISELTAVIEEMTEEEAVRALAARGLNNKL